jgi:hypothetical protein
MSKYNNSNGPIHQRNKRMKSARRGDDAARCYVDVRSISHDRIIWHVTRSSAIMDHSYNCKWDGNTQITAHQRC